MSSSAGWLGSGREKVVCKRASGSGGADGFSDAVGRRNIFRARRVCSGHGGAGGRPSLFYTKGNESKGRNEVLR